MKASVRAGRWFDDRQLNFLLIVNVLVVLVATWLSHGQFVDIDNLQSMGGQLPELGLLALGIMLSMVSGNGGIDLSGVGLANLSGMVAALVVPRFINGDDSPALYTALFCTIVVAMGLLGGLLNGVVIARLRLTPILHTRHPIAVHRLCGGAQQRRVGACRLCRSVVEYR